MFRRNLPGIVTLFAVAVAAAASRASDAGLVTSRARPSIEYRLERAPADRSTFNRRFTTAQRAVLEKINRADESHLARLKQLVVPSVWVDELEYSPFAVTYSPGAHLPKLLVVDLFAQAFAGYERGVLVRWGPVSSGRDRGATPNGLFYLTWRSRGHPSTVNPEWFMEWYFNFDNIAGLSLHEYELPGRPASHGCVRLLERDARWLYAWGDEWTLRENGEVATHGTPLLILNEYPFDSSPPWRDLTFVAAGVRLPERLPGPIAPPFR